MADADKAIAEAAKRKAVATERELVAEHEEAVKQARLQRSPQLRAAVKALDDAKKDLATANRKPLPDFGVFAQAPPLG